MTRLHRLGILAGACALAAACSLAPAPRPVAVYRLPPPDLPGLATRQALALKIALPTTPAGLEGRRIPVTRDGLRIAALAGARLEAPLPQLLRERLAEALRRDGRIAWVLGGEAIAAADLELAASVREFVVDLRGRPTASVRLEATLVALAGRRILAQRAFAARAEAAGERPDQLVTALAAALDQLALELAGWVEEAAARG
ncbi:MAG: hypothetical protein KatS3mg124_2395 [Porticoccaceae bacterium]|nr:MAG: hypothetical protein KatS3mg124_2395 [Porticoccaceae bacterium]